MTAENSRALQWFRWHHGTYNDPKWMTIASRANAGLASMSRGVTQDHAASRKITVGHVVSVWAAMMETASMANPRGELDGWDDEDVAAFLGYEPEEVAAIRAAMQGKTLEGIKLTAWSKRQPKREDPGAAERQQAKRDRQKAGVTDRDNDKSHAESHRVTQSHPRVEKSREEKKDQEQSSLRSDSSTAEPPTPSAKVVNLTRQADRLAQVTREAIAAFNEILAVPNGALSRVTDVGFDRKTKWVSRCVKVAREISQRLYQADHIQPKFWTDYFGAVAQDPFKAGRQQPGRGHENWKPTFEYLTRADVVTEVFEQATSAAEGHA